MFQSREQRLLNIQETDFSAKLLTERQMPRSEWLWHQQTAVCGLEHQQTEFCISRNLLSETEK